jgi:hypothetical protein
MNEIQRDKIYQDMVGETRFKHEAHSFGGNEIRLSAYWNAAEKWAELAVFTPWGNYGYRWDSTRRADYILRSTWDYLLVKLMGKENLEALDIAETLQQIAERMTVEGDALKDLNGCEDEKALWCWAQRWSIPNIDTAFAFSLTPEAQKMREIVVPMINAMGETISHEAVPPAEMGAPFDEPINGGGY